MSTSYFVVSTDQDIATLRNDEFNPSGWVNVGPVSLHIEHLGPRIRVAAYANGNEDRVLKTFDVSVATAINEGGKEYPND